MSQNVSFSKDVDIFNIPLYYISFSRKEELENHLSEHGFKNINHFQAIDGRKLKPDDLVRDGLLTIRSYNDLITGREQHSGISTLGAVGVTLSHSELWKKCISEQLPYIIIVEDDAYITRPFTQEDSKKISDAITSPNGLFISEHINRRPITQFFGMQFCVLSNEACEELLKNVFPIDVQVDSYIAHLNTVKRVNLEGYKLVTQTPHKSSIQDKCIKCSLPKSKTFYNVFAMAIIVVIPVILWLVFIQRKCQKDLKTCHNS